MMYFRIGLAALIFIGILTVGNFLYDPFHWKKSDMTKKDVEVALAHGEAALGTASAGLQKDASNIRNIGAKRDARIGEINVENIGKINQTEGANTILPPSVIATVNDGLCKYKSTAGCPSS